MADAAPLLHPRMSAGRGPQTGPSLSQTKSSASNSTVAAATPHSLVAYGNDFVAVAAGRHISLVDPSTTQVVATLTGHHQAPITCLAVTEKICPDDTPLLASGDSQGVICIWTVHRCSFQRRMVAANAISKIMWLPHKTNELHGNLLLVLHSNGTLSMWDLKQAQQVWNTDQAQPLVACALDPYQHTRLAAFSTQGKLVVFNDLSPKHPPDVKSCMAFALSSPRHTEQGAKTAPVHLEFWKYRKHQLLVGFQRYVMVLDLYFQQVVTSISLDDSYSAFTHFVGCSRSPAIYCLHHNSCVTVFAQDTSGSKTGLFHQRGQTEALRFRSSCRLQALALDARDERCVTCLASDGSLLCYQVSASNASPAPAPIDACASEQSLFMDKVALRLTKQLNVTSFATTIAVQPPVESANDTDSVQRLVALGAEKGYIELLDLTTLDLNKRIGCHTSSSTGIRRLQWVDDRWIITFSSDENAVGVYQNLVCLTDTQSGRVRVLRQKNEPSQLLHVAVSPLGQYILLVFDEQQMPEIWTRTGHLKTLPGTVPCFAHATWCLPARSKDNEPGLSKEDFCAITHDGQVLHFTVEGSVVKSGRKFPMRPGNAVFGLIAWKGVYVVTIDTNGVIYIWDLKTQNATTMTTGLSRPKQLVFAPDDSLDFAVVFESACVMFDCKQLRSVASYPLETSRKSMPVTTLTASAISFATTQRPVMLLSDGSVCITDHRLQFQNVHASRLAHFRPTACSVAYSAHALSAARTWALHHPWSPDSILATDSKSPPGAAKHERLLAALPSDVQHLLRSLDDKLPQRAIVTYRAFGDLFACDLFSVVSYVAATRATDSVDEADSAPQETSLPMSLLPLHTHKSVKRVLEADTHSGVSLGLDLQQADLLVQTQILTGTSDVATQALLQTPASKGSLFYEHSLRACLLACATGELSAGTRTTLKMAAINLILADRLQEGVEMLLLIGCVLEACRYLQNYNQWDQALLYAKAALQPDQATEIIERHAEHMSTIGRREQCVLFYASIANHRQVLAHLKSMQQSQLAAIYLLACEQLHLLDGDDELQRSSSNGRDETGGPDAGSTLSGPNRRQLVFIEYARYLSSIGMQNPARWVWEHLAEQEPEKMKEMIA